VESKRGRGSGSAFRVYLPVSAEHVARPLEIAAQAAPMEEVQWGGTVLLVEDDEILPQTVATTLTRLGFMVLDAKDRHEAVEMFSATHGHDPIRPVRRDHATDGRLGDARGPAQTRARHSGDPDQRV